MLLFSGGGVFLNTLIINGAVNENGECRKLIDIFNKNLGAEVINVYKENILPCADCGECRNGGGCVINDNMNNIYDKIVNADIIIFASPIYYSAMTGVMMNFLSRFQMFYLSGAKCREKRAALLLTGGGATKRTDYAEHQLKLALKIINAEYVGLTAYINTDRQSVIYSEETLRAVSELKKSLYGQNP